MLNSTEVQMYRSRAGTEVQSAKGAEQMQWCSEFRSGACRGAGVQRSRGTKEQVQRGCRQGAAGAVIVQVTVQVTVQVQVQV